MPLRAASRSPARLACLSLGLLLTAGCGHAEPFVWVDAVPLAVASPPLISVIGPGDVVAIRVWEQDAMSTRARVRDDGKISFPLVDDLRAVGLTPVALAREIEQVLRDKKLLNNPRVTVNIEEQRPAAVTVFGEVAHTGSFPVGPGASMLQVLASAGGLTEFANGDRIYVVRQGSPPLRIRFRYADLLRGDSAATSFRLSNGDIVIVE